jgi:hypothetical protein
MTYKKENNIYIRFVLFARQKRDNPENNGMYRQSDACCQNIKTKYVNRQLLWAFRNIILQVQMLLQCAAIERLRAKKRSKILYQTIPTHIRLSTIVHYSGCFVNHLNLHDNTYRMHGARY